MAATNANHEESDKDGVLLYYKYTPSPIENLTQLSTFYESNCSSLGLLGRVRLAPQGVNVTIGGKISHLHNHISSLLDSYGVLFEGTDFKLASCDGPLSMEVAKECGFTSLSIRIVKELVTLSANPMVKTPSISNAGKHLSALEFHSVLKNAGELLKEDSLIDFKKLVLLDARNLYETRIGKFESQEVETLEPTTRQYSDLPAWIDSNAEKLRGNCVLMYCTGGIRCEMASAYIRSKGAGFENVFQLYGGIQRYLEQFPDGGFFKGKNFVYDHRISVGSSNNYIMGKCLLCEASFDDYSSRCRCSFCRMLVLVCNDCQKANAEYVCELCQKHREVSQCVRSVEYERSKIVEARNAERGPTECPSNLNTSHLQLPCTPGPLKKLRILCLHGFRQNASSFKGRTSSLAKKLKSLAELVFVDAPHELPFIYQPHKTEPESKSTSPLDLSPPPKNCSKKYAWLVSPDFHGKTTAEWEKTEIPFDHLQYQQQTEGFPKSLSYLKSVVSMEGPFDGILGFSQGAAMATLMCAQRGLIQELGLRFVILCSGFAVNLEGYENGSITCPSLHVFGNDKGGDRQIKSDSSRYLASFFEDGCRVIVEHDSGHIIPTRAPYIDEVREFLRRFI